MSFSSSGFSSSAFAFDFSLDQSPSAPSGNNNLAKKASRQHHQQQRDNSDPEPSFSFLLDASNHAAQFSPTHQTLHSDSSASNQLANLFPHNSSPSDPHSLHRFEEDDMASLLFSTLSSEGSGAPLSANSANMSSMSTTDSLTLLHQQAVNGGSNFTFPQNASDFSPSVLDEQNASKDQKDSPSENDGTSPNTKKQKGNADKKSSSSSNQPTSNQHGFSHAGERTSFSFATDNHASSLLDHSSFHPSSFNQKASTKSEEGHKSLSQTTQNTNSSRTNNRVSPRNFATTQSHASTNNHSHHQYPQQQQQQQDMLQKINRLCSPNQTSAQNLQNMSVQEMVQFLNQNISSPVIQGNLPSQFSQQQRSSHQTQSPIAANHTPSPMQQFQHSSNSDSSTTSNTKNGNNSSSLGYPFTYVPPNHPGVLTPQAYQRHNLPPKAATSMTFHPPFSFNNLYQQQMNQQRSPRGMGSPTFFLRQAFENTVQINSPTPMSSGNISAPFGHYTSTNNMAGSYVANSNTQQKPTKEEPLGATQNVHQFASPSVASTTFSNNSSNNENNGSVPKIQTNTATSVDGNGKKLTIDTSPPTDQGIPVAFGQRFNNNMAPSPWDRNRMSARSNRPMTAPPTLHNLSPFVQHMDPKNPLFMQQRLKKPKKQVKQCKMKTKKATTGKGLWSEEEHRKFLEGLELYGRSKWKEISEYIGTRTRSQVSSHSQKYFKKLALENGEE